MRSHSQIIADAKDLPKLAERRVVSIHTVRSWAQRDSIPGEHWAGLVSDGLATLEELAAAAAAKREVRAAA